MPPQRRRRKKSASPGSASAQAVMEQILRKLTGGGLMASGREQQAQELFYEAMEARTPERTMELVRKALEVDPDNVDARLFMLQFAGGKAEERIEVLRRVVDSAARQLGPEAFEECKPHFWGFIETRPYMRAREQLAGELLAAGRLEEAAAEYEAMLELNPGDNQGVRYELLPCYLALGRLKEARGLIKRYPNDVEYNTVFAWGLVLLRQLTPRRAGLMGALAAARKQNPHMEAYLKGHRQLPKNTPGCYSPGSREEAVCYARGLKMAWFRHPGALGWLVCQKSGKPAGTD